MPHSFNWESVMIECDAFVDAIADFKVETDGKREYTQNIVIQYGSTEKVKILLYEFLLECKQAFEKSQLDLIHLLRRNKNHYQAAQASTIRQLNEQIRESRGKDRKEYEEQKDRFLDYFHHNYTLIDLISARMTNSPLDEHLQFKLRRVGLDWVINGDQQTEIQPVLLEPDKGLTAFQKMLFIRLLQEQNLFPKKPNNTDDAPELRAIALLTGMSYENQIKGSKGAAIKVNQLLNDKERINMTPQQAKPKLSDLNGIEKVAELLNANSIIIRIDQLRKDLSKILEN